MPERICGADGRCEVSTYLRFAAVFGDHNKVADVLRGYFG